MSFPTHERHPWMNPPEPEDRDDSAWCETCERFVPFGAEALCLVCGDDEDARGQKFP